MSVLVRLSALGLLFIGFSAPVVAENREVKIGREEHEKLVESLHFYKDEELNAYVDAIGQQLAANSDWTEIDYHFFIIDSPVINAFALPGGYVYVNRGLLAHLNSEAQLAAVLAHEIAHVTRHHAMRRRSKQRLGDFAALVATLVTWNTNVGSAIQLENAALVSGYGREMELEADEYGADYLYRSGYDPAAMIDVLSVLKDHERFATLKGREAGQAPSTYHGVFSTHPRNDQRLREVVSQAGVLPPGENLRGRDLYREKIDGMVYGKNATQVAPPSYARYASKSLGVTFVYPEDWTRSTQGQSIILTSPDGVDLELSVANPQAVAATPDKLLKQKFQVEKLKKLKPVYPDRANEGAYALVDTPDGDKRVAVIKSGSYEYYFDTRQPVPLSDRQDEQVLSVVGSFRRAEAQDFPPDKVQRIYFRRLQPGETFADLAADRALGQHTEQELRLINGYYPDGEAEPGMWIKMVR